MTHDNPPVLYQNPFSMTPDEFKAWWARLDEPKARPQASPEVIYLGPREASTETEDGA